MSDWLEGQLAQHLKPVAAPPQLAERLGFARPRVRQFPRMMVAVAAAVVMMAGGLAANREAPNYEAVQFVSADRSVTSVSLAHSAHSVAPMARQADCGACHSL